MVTPIAPPFPLTDLGFIEAFLSSQGVVMRLDDDFTQTTNTVEDAYLTDEAINFSTDIILSYLTAYDQAKLQNSYFVVYHCTVVACHWLCMRRAEGIPQSIANQYDSTMTILEAIKSGEMSVPRYGRRRTTSPRWSNVEFDPRYPLRKLRVQRPISSDKPTDYRQNFSRWAQHAYEIY